MAGPFYIRINISSQEIIRTRTRRDRCRVGSLDARRTWWLLVAVGLVGSEWIVKVKRKKERRNAHRARLAPRNVSCDHYS